MRTLIRLLAACFAALFVGAAAVQWNDPDFALWAGLYGVAALFSVLALVDRFPKLLGLLVSGFFFAWAAIIAIRFVKSGEPLDPDDQFLAERVREAGGLLVAAIWTLILSLAVKRVRPAAQG